MDYTQYKRWFGVGVKSGGQLGIGGVETTTAKMWNLGDGHSFDFELVSSRWGLGLGGSIGAVVILGYGFNLPDQIHREKSNDWGVSVAITEKLLSKSMLTSMTVAVALARAAKMAGMTKLSVEGVVQLRNLMHTLYAGYEASKRKGVICMDVPFAGAGVEVAAYATRGTIYTSNYSDPDFQD